MSTAGRSQLLPRLALALASILIALLVLEGAVRLRQWIKYRTSKPWVFQLVTDPRMGELVPQARIDTGRIRTDSLGFRNPEIEMPKPAGRIRLAFLGASTTFCMEVSGNEMAWPHLVADSLSHLYRGVTFDYVNAGVPGYNVAISLKNLRVRVAPLAPDFILYYEASNDLTRDTRILATQAGLYTMKADDRSPMARVSTAWYLVEKNLLIRKRAAEARSGKKLQFNADSLASGFQARLVEFLRAAQQTAPVVAVATFSHKVRRTQSPDAQVEASTSSLYYAPYLSIAGLLDGWDAYNRAIRTAAGETGVLLIGGEDSIPGDDAHFVDSVHFRDAGSRSMADRIIRALVASPEFNRLVESRGGHALVYTAALQHPPGKGGGT